MDRQEIFEEIARLCQITIPYVTTTINTTMIIDNDWIKVHRGRAYSSINQLKRIKRLVDLLEKEE